jgi:hypothetical protein
MECPTCGQPIRIGSRLCTSCGTWLLDDDLRVDKSVPSFATSATNPGPLFAPPPTAPTAPPPPPAAAGATRWAPPSAAQRVDQPPPGGVGAAPAFGAGTYAMPIDDGFEEHTILSSRRSSKSPFWTISLPNGAVELVTDRPIIVGREPHFVAALPQARLIPVPDPTRSVSKNHACFSMSGGTLVVQDLVSTNGIIITHADGREADIGVGGRAELGHGDRVELGDVFIAIGRA